MADVDGLVERAGRWTAARLSRRSFIARAGRTAMVVAGGTAITALWADPAGARVCGQTGVSAMCADFDCPDGVWGWCWYATGCCAGGWLKKICDCCVANYPNVHGYCPAGTNVKCIVESCDEDPRVQRVAITKILSDEPGVVADHVRRLRFPSGSPLAIVGDAEDRLVAPVATAAAAAMSVPLLLLARRPMSPGALQELSRLGTTKVLVVGSSMPREIDSQLESRGVAVVRPSTAEDPGVLSGELATHLRQTWGAGLRGTVCVAPGDALQLAPVAAAFAGAIGSPLVIGVDHAPTDRRAWLVGPGASQQSAGFGDAVIFPYADPVTVAQVTSAVAVTDPRFGGLLVLAAHTSPVLLNLAAAGAPLLLHDPNSVDRLAPWLADRRSLVRAVHLGGHAGSLGSPAYRKLQSVLNGFEIDRLVGVGGQGLPVYSQPLAERVLGQARRGPSPPPARFSVATRTWGRSGRSRAR